MSMAQREQRLLKTSILMTISVALIGIAFGLYAGSVSIVFDGMFDTVDASMSMLSLLVSKLLVKEVSKRFQQGYWHIEPMVIALNGSVLVLLCFYALLNSISSLMDGGRTLAFDSAIVYSVVISLISLVMYLYERRLNFYLKSDLVKLDVQSWLMSVLITASLLVAFIIGSLIVGTDYEYLSPYIDPLILAILASCLMAMPLRTVIRAFRQILMITPKELDSEISKILSYMSGVYGFEQFSYYATQVGRGFFVEIHIVLPLSMDRWRVSELDILRSEIAERIGREGADRWLAISFTRDHRWL